MSVPSLKTLTVLRGKQSMKYCLPFEIWKIEAQKGFAPSQRTCTAQSGHFPAQRLLTPVSLHCTTPAMHTLGKIVLRKGSRCLWVPSGSGLDIWRSKGCPTLSVGAAGHVRDADLVPVIQRTFITMGEPRSTQMKQQGPISLGPSSYCYWWNLVFMYLTENILTGGRYFQ